MLKTERMNLEEAVVCTAFISLFKKNTFDMEGIKLAINDYEKSHLGDYDTEFMLVINKDVAAKMLTTTEFIESYQAATKIDIVRYNYMGSIEVGINRADNGIYKSFRCSLYLDSKNKYCELRAKVKNINGIDVEELRQQALEDVQIRKLINALKEKGVIPTPLRTIDEPRI